MHHEWHQEEIGPAATWNKEKAWEAQNRRLSELEELGWEVVSASRVAASYLLGVVCRRPSKTVAT